MNAAEFIGQLFLARDVAHSVHLNTRSFSKHMALNTFYDNIIEFLESQLADLEAARYDVVPKTDSSLQQLIDNIVELYLTTLYKLKFLA